MIVSGGLDFVQNKTALIEGVKLVLEKNIIALPKPTSIVPSQPLNATVNLEPVSFALAACFPFMLDELYMHCMKTILLQDLRVTQP